MSKQMKFLCDIYGTWLKKNDLPQRCASELLYGIESDRLTIGQRFWLEDFISTWESYRSILDMIDKLTVTVPFTGDELYDTIKLYDILRDMDFELTETQVEVFEKLQDAEVNGGFF